MGLTRLALKIAAPAPKIEEQERFLFIGPHPDDIEIGCGATAAKLAAAGRSVTFLILTDGRYGDGLSGGVKGDALAELRRQEAVSAAAHLGVSDVRFLGLSDGGFCDFEDMLRGVAAAIGECRPDLVFAPDPDTTQECHADHLNAGRAAARMAYMAPYQGVMEHYGARAADVKGIAFYMTAKANRFVRIPKEAFRLQTEAVFGHHLSQFPEGSREAKDLALYMRLRSADFGLRCFSPHGEGFRVLGQTQMHCLPEPV